VLNSIPIQDSGVADFSKRFVGSKDTLVNTIDVKFTDAAGIQTATATPLLVSSINGKVDFASLGAATFYVLYWGSERNQSGHSVTVTSQFDPTGITVVLTETGPTTGVFRLNIVATSAISDASKNPPELQVGANDVITLKYTDASPFQTVSTSILVETTKPIFSNLTPAHGTSGQVSRPDVESDVTDADSTVSKKTITAIFAIDDNGDGIIDNTKPAQEVNVDTDGIITAVAGGFHAKQRLPSSMAPTSNATIYWWLKATDMAGNVGISDRQPTISSVADPCVPANFPSVGSLVGKKPGVSSDVAGCQPFSIMVDFNAPALSSAVTGSWWDTSKTTTDKTETNVKKAKNTSILVNFSENMDGASFQVSDFKVDGIAPLALNWYSGRPQSVFLTVPAMTASARPKIELVGVVEDSAGNSTSVGTISAAIDGIAPTLTVTITGTGTGGSRPVTTGQVTITIVANEDVELPTVSYSQILDHNATSTALSIPIFVIPTKIATGTYQAEFIRFGAGLYNVYVTANDALANNQGTRGSNIGPIDITNATQALLFEVDNSIGLVFGFDDPDDHSTALVWDFSDEEKEYGLDSNGVFTTTPADVITNYDTHATTTIISITIDGTDIMATLMTTDDQVFRHTPSILTAGTHEEVIKAIDAAGNLFEGGATFTVIPVAPVVEAGPNITINEGSTFTLIQTTFTDSNTENTHTALVDWGDGTTSTATVTESATSGSVTASHLYHDDEDSPFTVKVTITDNFTASHTDSFQLVVNNVNPTLTAGADQTINKGATLSLAPATFGDVGTLDTHSAVVIWGDGVHETVAVNQSAGTISGSHVYNADGVFHPTIVVVDDDGGLVVGSFKATVGTGESPVTDPGTTSPPNSIGAVVTVFDAPEGNGRSPVGAATAGAMAILTVAFIFLIVWRRRHKTGPKGGPAGQV